MYDCMIISCSVVQFLVCDDCQQEYRGECVLHPFIIFDDTYVRIKENLRSYFFTVRKLTREIPVVEYPDLITVKAGKVES